MQAREAKLLDFLKKSPQFLIPIYQRTYSWTEKECRQLWDDIVRSGSDEKISAHFVGSIVYIEKGLYAVMGPNPLLVIDGQQRLTTVTLLIAALSNALAKLDEEHREPVDGFSPRKLRNFYLLNPEEEGERQYKLILSQTDRASLIAIVNNREQPKNYSLRITENFNSFETWIAKSKEQLPVICNGLAKLVVVDISLNRDHDNPQLIFESMNSTGRELTQADLIRNFILMGLEPSFQTRLYESYWRPMEVDFGQGAYETHFDSFIRHYLTVKTGEIPNIKLVYDAFKLYSRKPEVSANGVEALVSDIRSYARYYCAMALGAENSRKLKIVFQDLRDLKVDVAYPFLLELYDDYEHGVLTQDDFLVAVRMIESYVFRRAICAIPTNSLNKTFTTFSRALRKDSYIESIQAYLLSLPSYRRFPDDEEFKRELKTRDLYNFPRRSYWLRRLENHNRKEYVPIDEYTIEHIMPQNDHLSMAWRSDLGSSWEEVHGKWLHTLGNLTLTGYNSEYSDRPFIEKRDIEGGFRQSPIRLNQGLGQLEQWNEATILRRADKLANKAVQVWERPILSVGVLDSYRPRSEASGYSINDHPFLLSAPVQELYLAFRKEVLALDPGVTEEYLKFYVAYKAETNFVDIVPQAKRLRLSLNMPFTELNDSKGICRDITGIGKWGNGDVEVGLSTLDELPYIMGLVRQSFERQMGNGNEE